MYTDLKHGAWLKSKVEQFESQSIKVIKKIEQQVDEHQFRLLHLFQKHGVSEAHLQSSTGYGYHDLGRETLEKIYADVFSSEAAIVRPQIISGTHAIAACLYGVLRPGDEFIYLTGKPYDTLFQVIGEKKDGSGSLADFDITYKEIPLTKEFEVDWNLFRRSLSPQTKLVGIQRSRGYSDRPSFSIQKIEKMIAKIRKYCPQAVIFVDNCYGEFVESFEPTHVGADLIAGSLIKNPGGGLAKSGGYIVGKKRWVEQAASRLVGPDLTLEGGATYGYLRDYYQGLFMAPHIVGEALKGAVFAAYLFEELGFRTNPRWNDPRTDIIQQITFKKPERLTAFCQSIQSASPIDGQAFLTPSVMPGYQDSVIMAAGTFVQGSSIELSADGPMRPPYIAYLQGGLTFSHVKIAILKAVDQLITTNSLITSNHP